MSWGRHRLYQRFVLSAIRALLSYAFTARGHLPERDPQKVKELLGKYMDESQQYESSTELGKESFAIDGTERRCQRPSDQEEQKRFYSGKKKTHTVKT